MRSDAFGEVLIPVARISLQGKKEIGVDVIVDGGAVISVFPRSLCELLGLNFDEGREAIVKTATGEEIRVRILAVKMTIGHYSLPVRIAFSKNENIPYVLGRLDVIDKVEIRFERNGTRFVMKHP